MCAVGGLKGEMKFGGGEAERTEMGCRYPNSQVCIQLKKKKQKFDSLF